MELFESESLFRQPRSRARRWAVAALYVTLSLGFTVAAMSCPPLLAALVLVCVIWG